MKTLSFIFTVLSISMFFIVSTGFAHTAPKSKDGEKVKPGYSETMPMQPGMNADQMPMQQESSNEEMPMQPGINTDQMPLQPGTNTDQMPVIPEQMNEMPQDVNSGNHMMGSGGMMENQ